MFKVNEYYSGKVKSISFKTGEFPATAGVMADGEYEFGTSSKEFMTVTSGKLKVKLPGETSWKTYGPNETFIVEANVKFQVKAEGDISYICIYK